MAGGAVIAIALALGLVNLDVAEAIKNKDLTLVAGAVVTVTGKRVSMANGVECSKIVDVTGRTYGVSYLPPHIAIGATVTVSGPMGISTECRGTVIVVQDLKIRS